MKPEELNFHVNYDVIDPFVLYDNIPQPSYLEIQNYDNLVRSFESSKDKSDDEESIPNQQRDTE
jgi:hypothetical protein